jgi:UDP-N-acetylmuramyl pentapeptide synthase
VLEAGTNHPGELAPLISMIQPRFGIITSIGREHLEFFGDIDGVTLEEGSLAEQLPQNGLLFINGDCPESAAIMSRSKTPVVRLGFGSANDWAATILQTDASGVFFEVKSANSCYNGAYKIPLLGRHQAGNALFAIALGAELGLNKDEIQAGLSQCLPAKMRLQIWTANGVRVLDDAYNANADSMLAALDTLQSLPCEGRRVAVLGEMAELGAHREEAHAEVGRKAGLIDKAIVITVGAMCKIMAAEARVSGMNPVMEFETVEEVTAYLKDLLKAGDTVLLKASRSARFERIGEAIRAMA